MTEIYIQNWLNKNYHLVQQYKLLTDKFKDTNPILLTKILEYNNTKNCIQNNCESCIENSNNVLSVKDSKIQSFCSLNCYESSSC